jgi:non-homologous end joining protein Ku
MRYADEVLPADELGSAAEDVDLSVLASGSAKAAKGKARGGAAISDREVAMAEQLVEALASEFEPTQYRDEYRDCVMDMLNRKAGGEVIASKPAPQRPATKGKDLTDALRASLEHVKQNRKKGA